MAAKVAEELRTLVGRCQFGAVTFRVEDAFVYASNCHCSSCCTATGSAFKAFAGLFVFEDQSSVRVKFDHLVVNLLLVSAALQQVDPGRAASADAGSRFQLSVWVDDVDATCALLQERGVELLAGPVDREWGMRTATFADPAGQSWEIAQPL
jgi:catechol 2,3-dioxygenase-like lactoylglutathione lyase family enzyme